MGDIPGKLGAGGKQSHSLNGNFEATKNLTEYLALHYLFLGPRTNY